MVSLKVALLGADVGHCAKRQAVQKGLGDLAGPGGAGAAADALRLVDTYVKVGVFGADALGGPVGTPACGDGHALPVIEVKTITTLN